MPVDPQALLTLAQAGQASSAAAGGKVGTGLAKGIGTATTVSSLLTTAGISSFVAPPASWIVTAGAATAAGVVALVGHLRKSRHYTRKQALALAAQYGIPDASEIPSWTVRVMNASMEKRYKLGKRVEGELRRAGHAGPASWFRSRRRLQVKLAVVGAVIAWETAAARGAAPPATPPSELAMADWAPVIGGVVLLGILAVVIKNRRA